jgi:hypothetical protein
MVLFKENSFEPLFLGYLSGLTSSGFGGFLLGIYVWCIGDERSILQIIIENSAGGLRLGLLFGLSGTLTALILTKTIVKTK